MIDDIYGRHKAKQVTCDNCGDGFEAESFDQALEVMKQNGWRKMKVEGVFVHLCPDCEDEIQRDIWPTD